MHYEIQFDGIPPGLVMNNPISMSTPNTKVPKPAEEAEQKCYRTEPAGKFKKGELYVPGEAVMACILSVTAPFKIPLGGKKVAVKKWIGGGSLVDPPRVGLGQQDYEVYVTTAVVMGRRVLRARARLPKWGLAFRLIFDDSDPIYQDLALGLKPVMRDILTMAGAQSGLLDNRPGSPKKPGPHGRFKVVKCELVE